MSKLFVIILSISCCLSWAQEKQQDQNFAKMIEQLDNITEKSLNEITHSIDGEIKQKLRQSTSSPFSKIKPEAFDNSLREKAERLEKIKILMTSLESSLVK